MTWLLAAFVGLAIVDASLAIWLLTHNGRKLPTIMSTPIRWWGPEGVILARVFAFLVVMWFASSIELWMWGALIAVYVLVCLWNTLEIVARGRT